MSIILFLAFATTIGLRKRIKEMNLEIKDSVENMKKDEWGFLRSCRDFVLLGHERKKIVKEKQEAPVKIPVKETQNTIRKPLPAEGAQVSRKHSETLGGDTRKKENGEVRNNNQGNRQNNRPNNQQTNQPNNQQTNQQNNQTNQPNNQNRNANRNNNPQNNSQRVPQEGVNRNNQQRKNNNPQKNADIKGKTATFITQWVQKGLREGAVIEIPGMGKFEMNEEKREVVNPYTQEKAEVVSSRKLEFYSNIKL